MKLYVKYYISFQSKGTFRLVVQIPIAGTGLGATGRMQSRRVRRHLYHNSGKTLDLCVAPVTGLLWGCARSCDVTRSVKPCWLVTSASCRSIQPASRCDGTTTRSPFNLSYSGVRAITGLFTVRSKSKRSRVTKSPPLSFFFISFFSSSPLFVSFLFFFPSSSSKYQRFCS